MTDWRKRICASIALRFSGLTLLGTAWLIGCFLAHRVEAYPHEASPPELLLGLALFACLSAGIALTVIGPGLFGKVSVSARWIVRAEPVRMAESLSDDPEWQ